jgi:hypothetical protein
VRLGCGGCLTSLVMLGLLATLGTSVWGMSRALQNPGIPAHRATAEDAARAQQKLFRVVRGGGTDAVMVSEAELNAFVSRNVDRRDLPFDDPIIFLHDGDTVDVVGQMPLGRLLADSPLGLLAGLLPERWRAQPVWLRVGTHAEFEREPRRQLRVDVRRVTVGQQRVPAIALRLLFEPARLRFVRIGVPATVGDIRIQSGRVVIRPTSSRERT